MLRELPDGYLVDTQWLKDLGLSPSSIHGYVRSGWLEHLGPRLYRRANPALDDEGVVHWEICVLSLQNVLGRPVHVGAMTALELAGYWQYAIFGERRVWLYTDDGRAKALLSRTPVDASLELRSKKLFRNPDIGLETRILDLASSALGAGSAPAAARSPLWKQQLRVSSLERGILEVLAEIPAKVSFDHGSELFEGLTTMRPTLMKRLLHDCTSIKAKRLFFYFAGRHRPRGARHFRPDDFDLGSGKRQIVPGGRYDPEFRITVPRRGRGG